MLRHSWIWFVNVVARVDSSADRLGAPVGELSALELRPIEYVSWIINVSAIRIPVSWCNLDRYTRILICFSGVKIPSHMTAAIAVTQWKFLVSHSSPAVRISCPLIGQNSFAPATDPFLSYIKTFYINIVASLTKPAVWQNSAPMVTPQSSLEATTHSSLEDLPMEVRETTVCTPVFRGGSWCHWAQMRLLAVWCHWVSLLIHDDGLGGSVARNITFCLFAFFSLTFHF